MRDRLGGRGIPMERLQRAVAARQRAWSRAAAADALVEQAILQDQFSGNVDASEPRELEPDASVPRWWDRLLDLTREQRAIFGATFEAPAIAGRQARGVELDIQRSSTGILSVHPAAPRPVFWFILAIPERGAPLIPSAFLRPDGTPRARHWGGNWSPAIHVGDLKGATVLVFVSELDFLKTPVRIDALADLLHAEAGVLHLIVKSVEG